MKNRLNGTMFEGMVRNGLNNILNYESKINEMNVFPVADGDTGTNMRLTLENGINKAKSSAHLGQYLKELSVGMLFGARGNSGVILSQIFKGFATELARDSIASPGEIEDALIRGYKTAYSAVEKPTEGTILTVCRLGIVNIRKQLYTNIPIESLFSMYLNEMRKELENTPNLLPILKQSGVLDSGAYGYIIIFEGMVKYLYGEMIELKDKSKINTSTSDTKEIVFFDEKSEFKEGYCMEFLLQRLKYKSLYATFNLEAYTNALKKLGNSIVTVEEGQIIKVHVHTLEPAKIIELSQAYGEFITFKLENMQIQHNEYSFFKKEKLPYKKLGIIAVADGEGFEELFKDLGCDIVIKGGSTMNTSSEEFIDAFEVINSEKIVVLPNNKNIHKALSQAIDMANLNNVVMIPTRSLFEGYYALAMDIQDSDDIERRINLMKDGASSITSLSFSHATKEYHSTDFNCQLNDIIGCINGDMIVANKDLKEAIKETIIKLDLSEKTNMIVSFGTNLNEDEINELTDYLYDNYSNLDIEFLSGGQHIYDVLIGLI